MSPKTWRFLNDDTWGLVEPAPLTLLGPYFRTRSLIQKRHPIWTLPIHKVKEKNLLGPWTFNVYETILATIPVSIMIWFLDLINEGPSQENNIDRIAETLVDFLHPVTIPLTLLILANIAASSALKKDDYSKEKRNSSKYAYLYLDGAYGLIPQAFFSLSITGIIELTIRESNNDGLFGFFGLLFLVSFLWLLLTEWMMIGRKLFIANGYTGQQHGPCLKYLLSMSCWGIVISTISFIALWVVSYLIANLLGGISI